MAAVSSVTPSPVAPKDRASSTRSAGRQWPARRWSARRWPAGGRRRRRRDGRCRRGRRVGRRGRRRDGRRRGRRASWTPPDPARRRRPTRRSTRRGARGRPADRPPASGSRAARSVRRRSAAIGPVRSRRRAPGPASERTSGEPLGALEIRATPAADVGLCPETSLAPLSCARTTSSSDLVTPRGASRGPAGGGRSVGGGRGTGCPTRRVVAPAQPPVESRRPSAGGHRRPRLPIQLPHAPSAARRPRVGASPGGNNAPHRGVSDAHTWPVVHTSLMFFHGTAEVRQLACDTFPTTVSDISHGRAVLGRPARTGKGLQLRSLLFACHGSTRAMRRINPKSPVVRPARSSMETCHHRLLVVHAGDR